MFLRPVAVVRALRECQISLNLVISLAYELGFYKIPESHRLDDMWQHVLA